ncbi:MAG: hypothetical protein M0Q13_10840 [Methanothrix sp.]|nr:hypothetical protein [Methanothrix sp.]
MVRELCLPQTFRASPGIMILQHPGCYADPLTGEITCIGSNAEPSDAQRGQKNGCYQDPYTGQYVCVESYGESEGYQEETQGDGSQNLCYEDPETGETICTGSS